MMSGRLDSTLELQEAVLRQYLAVRGERLEDGDAGSQALVPIAGGQMSLARDADDRAARYRTEQVSLVAERNVARAAEPGVCVLLLESEGENQLDLIPHSEAALVD